MYDLQAATTALLTMVSEMKECPRKASGQRDGNKSHGIEKRCFNKLIKAGVGRNEANEMIRDAMRAV